MKTLIIISALFLSGCVHTSISEKMRNITVGTGQSMIAYEFGEPDSHFRHNGTEVWSYMSGARYCFVEFKDKIVITEPFCKYDRAEAARINADNAAIWQNIGNAISESGKHSSSQYYQDYGQAQASPSSPGRNCLGKIKPYSSGCQFKCINDDWVSVCE